MNCSGLREPIGDSLPWGMAHNDGHLQVAFGSGDGGFVILTKDEARDIIDRIRSEDSVIICGQTLSDDQATEMAGALEWLLKAL